MYLLEIMQRDHGYPVLSFLSNIFQNYRTIPQVGCSQRYRAFHQHRDSSCCPVTATPSCIKPLPLQNSWQPPICSPFPYFVMQMQCINTTIDYVTS